MYKRHRDSNMQNPNSKILKCVCQNYVYLGIKIKYCSLEFEVLGTCFPVYKRNGDNGNTSFRIVLVSFSVC